MPRQEGNRDKAIADLTEAIRLDPECAEAYRGRGVPMRGKAMGTGLFRFQRGHPAQPEICMGLQRSGPCLHNKGDKDKAIIDLSEAIRHQPKAAVAYDSGFAYGNKGDYNKAIRIAPRPSATMLITRWHTTTGALPTQ